ncbi:MAG: hypothetical protein LC734_10030 [Acidobacteria bacterium]|nr:hypothetical protein [Acidobacteriota bacterium]
MLGLPTVRRIEFRIDESAILVARSGKNRVENELREKDVLAALPVSVLTAAESIDDAQLKKSFLLAAGNCMHYRRPGRA